MSSNTNSPLPSALRFSFTFWPRAEIFQFLPPVYNHSFFAYFTTKILPENQKKDMKIWSWYSKRYSVYIFGLFLRQKIKLENDVGPTLSSYKPFRSSNHSQRSRICCFEKLIKLYHHVWVLIVSNMSFWFWNLQIKVLHIAPHPSPS